MADNIEKTEAEYEAARDRVADPDTRKARLQLRWEKRPEDADDGYLREGGWLCHYELMIPLQRWDIRREDSDSYCYRDEITVPIKPPSWRGSDVEPCKRGDDYYYDTPYRDGSHAKWDAALLGDLEVVVIACDGEIIHRSEGR